MNRSIRDKPARRPGPRSSLPPAAAAGLAVVSDCIRRGHRASPRARAFLFSNRPPPFFDGLDGRPNRGLAEWIVLLAPGIDAAKQRADPRETLAPQQQRDARRRHFIWARA